ncbi:EAL domain-containing protein [Affinibrenneria salicis]|uniref:EAL domain-containing protein n=1 Tax=Affinibrenneria salicis TaxID=2590031 RepID=A0A5J5FRS2_9GAMM|nr:EAL domain-containing protein [Affinibrenneria salicis]KAA8995705.1 EAL domain-containing protein [Affinibrenneria salicis]
MSLFKQLLIAICLFVVIIFSGSFVVSLESSRDQYSNQLRSHAQDAATALGLSLTPHIDDPAMTELMVSSIFDSGYFYRIRIIEQKSGRILQERNASPDVADVPQWFVRLVNLQPGAGEALIMRGWEQAARVEVISHPMFAIARLWRSTLASLLWLLGCSAAGLLAGAFLLRRQLRPLDYMVEQSLAITRREFLSLPELPRTPELRRVVQAMNLMVTKLKSLFEEQAERSERFRQEAYQDSHTGLANRRAFDIHLQARLSDEETPAGYLILIRMQDLAGLNQRFGSQHTDDLLRTIAQMLTEAKERYSDASSMLARIRGGEFAMLCPGLVHSEAQTLLNELSRQLETLYGTGEIDVSPVVRTGIVAFRVGDTPHALMVEADRALTSAETQTGHQAGGEVWREQPHIAEDRHLWFNRLDPALEHDQFQLFFQPVVNCQHPQQILHHKVLARIVDENGNSVAAGRFLPWIHRFGWSQRLDQVMLRLVLKQLQHHDGTLALSLSGSSVLSLATIDNLLQPLKQSPHLAQRLVLELDENQLPEPALLEALIKRLSDYGCRPGLQHFGGRFNMIGNLSQWGLAWIKVDGGYIRNIDREADKRMFIEALYRATNSIDLPLIAERVETEGELQVLQEMGIQGAMGRLLGEPAPC